MSETWKPLNENYDVSDHGRIRSWNCRWGRRKKPLIMKQNTSDRSYCRVGLKGYSYPQRVHRLVLEVFVGPCPEGMEACHNDDDSGNNHLSNLRWDTHSENNKDKWRH